MTRQRRHHADRAQGTDPDAGLPGPGQALIGFPEPESSLFGVPLQAGRAQVTYGQDDEIRETYGQVVRERAILARVSREQLARAGEPVTATGRTIPPRPRTSPEGSPGARRRRSWPSVLGLPLAVLALGVALGVIAVVMLVAAGVPAPWETRTVVAAPVAPLPSTPAADRSPALGATEITADGTYRVGPDVRPGRYVTEGGVSCHWARLRDSGRNRTVVAEGNGSGRTVIRIRAADAAFQTSGCTTWTRR